MEEEKYNEHEKEVEEVVQRYERMKRNNDNFFFDVSEFEAIIDYYIDNNNHQKAFEAAETAVHQHPNSISIQLRQARVLLDKGRAVETLRILRRLESIEPGNHEIYLIKGTALGMLGDVAGARKMFDTALEYDTEEPENTLYAITSILQNLNFYEDMISYMHKLIEMEPYFPAHCFDLAYAYDKTGHLEEAVKYYEQYLDEEPLSDSAWYNVGIVYNRLGKYEKALEAYDYALAINPVNTFALFNKGNILCNLERFEEAVVTYEEYLGLEKDSADTLTYIGECHEKLGRPGIAKKYFLEAIEIDSDIPDPWFGLGVLAFKEGMFNDAMMFFSKCVRLDDQDPENYHMLARSFYALGKLKESIRNLQKALKIDPFFYEAWIDMATIIHETNIASKLVNILEKAARISGDIPGLNYLLAYSHLVSGQPGKAYIDLIHATATDKEIAEDFLFLYPEELLTDPIKKLIKKL